MDLAGDELRLERLPVDPDKLVRVRGPGRQLHVAHLRPVLDLTELEPVHVDEHLGEAEKLRNQFLNEEWKPFLEQRKKTEFTYKGFRLHLGKIIDMSMGKSNKMIIIRSNLITFKGVTFFWQLKHNIEPNVKSSLSKSLIHTIL